MKIIKLLCVFLLINISLNAKPKEIYSLFDKDLRYEILKISRSKNILSFEKINFENNRIINFNETLHPTAHKGFYFVNMSNYDSATTFKYCIVNFIEDQKVMCIYIDTSFNNIEEINDFLSINNSLDKHIPFYLIKNTSLKKIKNYPSITAIKPNDLILLKAKNKARIVEFKANNKELTQNENYKMYVKSNLWLNMQCLVMGYQFPMDAKELNWLNPKIAIEIK